MKDLILKHLHESCVTSTEFPQLAAVGVCMAGFTNVHGKYLRRSSESDYSSVHLQVTLSGEAQCLIDDEWVGLPANTVYVAPEGVDWAWRYNATSGSPWKVLFVRLIPEFAKLDSLSCNKPYLLKNRDPSDLIWTFLRLYRETLSKVRIPVISGLSDLLAYHSFELINADSHSYILHNLWFLVAGNLCRKWDVAMLSREAKVNPEKLRVVCHRETGRSPMAQVTYLRMRRAIDLLVQGELSVQEIGLQVGYENQFNFSRAFKRLYGMSPTEFRKTAGDHPHSGSQQG